MSYPIPGPLKNPGIWDHVIVGGQYNPGLCFIRGFKRANSFDVKMGKGSFGATITYKGRPPAKGVLVFQLHENGHDTDTVIEEWISWADVFQYDPTKSKITGVDIYHPALAAIKIKSIVCEDIGLITHKGKGLYEVEVSCLEYFPPPPTPAVSTPTSSDPNAGKPFGHAYLSPTEQTKIRLREEAAAGAARSQLPFKAR